MGIRFSLDWKGMDLVAAQPYYVLGVLPPEELPSIACNDLLHGRDGDALLELASLSRQTWREVGDLVDRALAEIGLPKQSKEEAWRSIAAHILDCVKARTISVKEAGYQLGTLPHIADYPAVLRPFAGVEDYLELELLTDDQWEAALVQEMMELHARWERGDEGNLIDEYGWGALYWVRRYGAPSKPMN